jgi:Replication protein C N-terminal domain
MEAEQSLEPRLPQGELHRVFRLAAIAHGLPDAVLVTSHALLRYIPRDAEHPISPARVQDLADERGCDPRTIRSPIRRLEAHGLVVDRSAGGGRRMIQRRRGQIVVLQGIDFSPMLEAADALAPSALEAEAELDGGVAKVVEIPVRRSPGRVRLRRVRRRGQGFQDREAGKGFPIRRPFASRSGRRPGAPRTASAPSRRRAAPPGS